MELAWPEEEWIGDDDDPAALRFGELEAHEAAVDTVFDSWAAQGRGFLSGRGDRSVAGDDELHDVLSAEARVLREFARVAVLDLVQVAFNNGVDEGFIERTKDDGSATD